MNLIIDIGNSRTKAAIFSGGEIIERWYSETLSTGDLDSILEKYPDIHGSILSSTRDEGGPLADCLSARIPFFIRFTTAVPTPLRNLYDTPATLGPDRLAAAVGAHHLYPGRNLLVVDFGTAMTIDVVTAGGEYLGGNISPGARTRFRALSDYTSRLPLGSLPEGEINKGSGVALGKSTAGAIEAGVVNGIIFELEGYRRHLETQFKELIPIFTGGESKFFAEKLKNTIFAHYDLVLVGLNTILEYNADKEKTI